MNEFVYKTQRDPVTGFWNVPVSFGDAKSKDHYKIPFISIWRVKLNLYTRLRAIQGGQAVAWMDKDDKKLRVLRICSLTEFYDISKDKCMPCSDQVNVVGDKTVFSSVI